LKNVGAPRFTDYYARNNVIMNIQNVNVAQLHSIHKPLPLARFEHNILNEAEYVVSDSSEELSANRGHLVEFDSKYGNAKSQCRQIGLDAPKR